MGRIEDAIQKLQSSGTVPASGSRASGLPLGRVVPTVERGALEHSYGGRSIQVDLHALRSNGLLAPDSEMSRLAEEYRIIKRPLVDNADPVHEPPVPIGNLVMVASALSGEGKTFTCVNLSLSIAREKDWTVVLVDGDCSKPHLTRLFSAEGERGLLDLLRDPGLEFDSVVMPTDVPGLSLLPAGRRDQNSAELLSSRRMRELCERASAADPQRMIVFDSSPLLLTSEAPVLASQVGQVVVVVRADSTVRQAVVAAIEKIDSSKPVGCVLNQQTVRAGAIHGYYGYGDYGA